MTQRAFIDTKHIEFESWGPPLVDADWHAFCQDIYKGIEGKEWEELYCHDRDTSKATGAKNPSETQKSERAMTAKDRDEEFHDLACKIFQAEPKPVWKCGQNISKTRWRHWKRRWSAWKLPTNVDIGFADCRLSLQWRFPAGKGVGLSWTLGMFWVCVQDLVSGMSR